MIEGKCRCCPKKADIYIVVGCVKRQMCRDCRDLHKILRKLRR